MFMNFSTVLREQVLQVYVTNVVVLVILFSPLHCPPQVAEANFPCLGNDPVRLAKSEWTQLTSRAVGTKGSPCPPTHHSLLYLSWPPLARRKRPSPIRGECSEQVS